MRVEPEQQHDPTDGNSNGGDGGSGSGQHDAGNGSNTIPADRSVFVIVMENESSSAIYGSAAAPYINTTIKPESAYATMFTDELPSAVPSEPHYVWMEAGTNDVLATPRSSAMPTRAPATRRRARSTSRPS